MLKSGVDEAKFILTHSLFNDRCDVRRSYSLLAETFDNNVKDSTLLLMTKSNMLPEP